MEYLLPCHPRIITNLPTLFLSLATCQTLVLISVKVTIQFAR